MMIGCTGDTGKVGNYIGAAHFFHPQRRLVTPPPLGVGMQAGRCSGKMPACFARSFLELP